MTKQEVVERTLRFETTPYMPTCTESVTAEFLLHVTGEKEFTLQNARDIFFRAMQLLDNDIVLQYVLPYPERYERFDEANIMPRAHQFTPSIIFRSEKGFKTPEDVRDYILTLPEPDSLERNFNCESNYLAWVELIHRREEFMGDMVWIPGFIARTPNFMLYSYFGYEPYLMALELYKPEMKRLFEISGEEARLRNTAIAKANVDHHFLNWVFVGEDICDKTGPLCRPSTLRELYWPIVKKAMQPLKDAGIKILWHCDGNIMPILSDLIDIGADGLQGFEEENGVDLSVLSDTRTKDGKKMVLVGSVSVTTTLPMGTVEDVKRKVEAMVELSQQRGGGVVLASSSSILSGTPVENIEPMYGYVKEYSQRIFMRNK